jgi:hypothetical protein
MTIYTPRGTAEFATAFDAYSIIRTPLPEYEDRVFKKPEGGGTCYGSHTLHLATGLETFEKNDRYILMQHGSARVVLKLPTFYSDGGAMRDAWEAMPDAVLYATLYTIQKAITQAAADALYAEADRWAKAHVENRIRRKKAQGNRTRVTIETPREKAARLDA